MKAIELHEPDPRWPAQFEVERARITAALADTAIRIEHVGSTSVPGLAAKPVIDIDLVVPDTTDEGAYLPQLLAAGYTFRIREPDWYEHRLLKGTDPAVNLHVFPVGCPEIERMIAFRDRLRADAADRELYERTKRALATRRWPRIQDYADAKSDVVADIMSRAQR
jgi:GrpB-like predicted nucleotidyltransferase (UPF0157 family)